MKFTDFLLKHQLSLLSLTYKSYYGSFSQSFAEFFAEFRKVKIHVINILRNSAVNLRDFARKKSFLDNPRIVRNKNLYI
jgi:hypothetical protein